MVHSGLELREFILEDKAKGFPQEGVNTASPCGTTFHQVFQICQIIKSTSSSRLFLTLPLVLLALDRWKILAR